MENFKTFPLTVSEGFLDEIDRLRKKDESKHKFIIQAVYNEFEKRKGEKKNGKTT